MSVFQELDREYRKLMNWMVKNSTETLKARKDFQERVIKKRCIYGQAPFHITLMPLFLKEKSLKLLQETCEVMDALNDRIITLYFEDPYVRDYFPYWHLPKEWIEAYPGYKKPSVINRHDVLFDGKNLKFIEFNTDNPGGIGWTDIYESLFKEHSLYKNLIGKYGAARDRGVVTSLFNTVLSYYRESGFEEEPRVALVSFRGLAGNQPEGEIVRDFFLENGIEANMLDARDFEFKNKRLWAGGIKYPIILRSLRADFYTRYPRDVRDFIRGVTSKAAVMFNSFRSIIGSHKTQLSFLSNPINHHYFSKKEISYIQKYIPWTRRLDETVTLSKEGEEVSLRPYLLSKREELVLKPSWGAGGYQVIVGKTTPEHKWRETVEEKEGDPSWIVQEFMEIPEVTIPVIKKNKIVLENKYFNLSPYCIGGKYAGILGRVSEKDVINVSAGGGLIPIIPLKGK